MNKKHPVIPFLSGVLATVLTMGCVTTALAASGLVEFSPVGLQLNRKAIFAAGDSVETESGQSVPSSLLYTDEAGGGTTYLPLRTIAELLDVPITWDGENNTVVLGRSGTNDYTIIVGGLEQNWDKLPLNRVGEKVGPFTEVEPVGQPTGETATWLKNAHYRAEADFDWEMQFIRENHRYLSVTVTNNGDKPLMFRAGHRYITGQDMLDTQIPAGATVTRTFEAEESGAGIYPTFAVDICTASPEGGTVDIDISAVEFGS